MPSGPKKRRAARKKEGLGIILDSKEDTKLQDATGTTSTHPIKGDKPAKENIEVVVHDVELPQKESEVNLLVPDFKGDNANQAISFEDFIDHKTKFVYASDRPFISNNNKKVVSHFQSEDNVEDDDSNTVGENLSLHVKHAGLDFPTDDVRIHQDVVVADTMVNQDASKTSTEILSEEVPFKDAEEILSELHFMDAESVDMYTLNLTKTTQKEEHTQPNLSFHNHNVGLDFPTANEEFHGVVVAQKMVNVHADAAPSDLPTSIDPMVKEEYINAKPSFLVHNACLDPPTADERIHDLVVADNVIDQDTPKICNDVYSQESPVNDDAVPSDLPTPIVPLENEGSPLPNASHIPKNPDQEEEVLRVNFPSHDGTKCVNDDVLFDKEDILEDKKEVELKKKLKSIAEVIWKNKKMVEEELNALSKFREILLESLDGLNAIQLPEIM